MVGSDEKRGGFSQVAHPKQGLDAEPTSRRPSRRDVELAKTIEWPPPSAALKPNKKGVDPLAQTGAFSSSPPSEGSDVEDRETAEVESEQDSWAVRRSVVR